MSNKKNILGCMGSKSMSEEQEFQYDLECDDGSCYEIPAVGVAVEQPIFKFVKDSIDDSE